MYVRPPNYKYHNPVRVPDNYAGNTFRASPKEDTEQQVNDALDVPSDNARNEPEQTAQTDADNATQASLLSSQSERGFRLRLGSLFKNGGMIGTEELLILALILLLADSDGNGLDDVILFLALLLFIK